MAAREASIEAGLERQLRLHEDVQTPTGDAAAAAESPQPAGPSLNGGDMSCSITQAAPLTLALSAAHLSGASLSSTFSAPSNDGHAAADASDRDSDQASGGGLASSSTASMASQRSEPDDGADASPPSDAALTTPRSGSSAYSTDNDADDTDTDSDAESSADRVALPTWQT